MTNSNNLVLIRYLFIDQDNNIHYLDTFQDRRGIEFCRCTCCGIAHRVKQVLKKKIIEEVIWNG